MAGLSASRWAKKAADTKTEPQKASDTKADVKTDVKTDKDHRPVSSSTVSVFSEKEESESDSDVDTTTSSMSPAAKAFAARLGPKEEQTTSTTPTPTTPSPRKTLGQSRWANTNINAKTPKKIDPKDVPLISTPPRGPASEYKKNGVSANDLRSRLAPPTAPVAPFETVPEDVAKQQRRDLREKEREANRSKKMGVSREWDDDRNDSVKERRNSRNRRESFNAPAKLENRFEKPKPKKLPERQERPKKPTKTPVAPKTEKPKELTAEEAEALRLKFEQHLKMSESKNFAWDDEEDDMWA